MQPLARLAILALLAPLALATAIAAPAAPATPSPATAGSVTAGSVTGAPEAAAKNGLRISADVHEEYVTGFPMLVTVTVRNDGDKPLTFPDLGARPHLVRFTMKSGTTRWERYTTPPATEPTTMWTIPAQAQRRVTLEIPSSGGLAAGAWELAVAVQDPTGAITLPTRTIRLAAAQPVGGSYTWEPAIQQSVGAMVPWLHQGTGGFDLYLLQLDPRAPTRTLGQFFLARLPARVEPVLTRARPVDALSRYLYWQSSPQTFTFARLEGTTLRGKPRTVSLPFPAAELLGRGGTDAKGGAVIPLWVPDPAGTSGAVLALCVDDRGAQVLRQVVRLGARPTAVSTAVDAGSNLVLALGHAAGVDVYRIDPALAPEIGARGSRVTPLTDGWAPTALAFDTLPDRGERAGGLALLTVLTRGDTYRAIWSDLGGKLIEESAALPWTAPGNVVSVLPAGYGPFYYLTQDPTGAVWYGAQGAAPQKLDGARPGTLWPGAEAVQLRRIVAGTVIEDRTVGTLAQ
ncbi:MAG: hypothetical protein Q8P41_19180 [Pseudomonadota bacterium]|nr:hypothetical protein [Pseudomonadota bacterium]